MIVVSVVALFLATIPFVGFRAYARRVEAAEDSIEGRVHRLDRAQQVGGFALPIVAIMVIFSFSLPDRVATFLEEGVPRVAEIPGFDFILSLVLAFGLMILPLVGAVLGAHPVRRTLRKTSASSFRVVKGTIAAVTISVVCVLAVLGGYLAITSVFGTSVPVIVVAISAVVFAVFGLAPYLMVVFHDRVSLSGQQRDRVDRLCADLGYAPRGLYVLEGASTKTANAMVAGTVPGFRYVFLTDYLLEEASDEQLRAILAHELGHVAGRHLWQRGLLTVATICLGVLAYEPLGISGLEERFGFVGVFLPVMAGYVVYHVILLGGLAYWQEYRADAYAARAAGTEATAQALELLATANDTPRRVGLLYALATHHPAIGERIDALRTDV